MTMTETAAAMRKLADCIDTAVRKTGSDCDNGRPKPMFTDDAAIGAALLLCYIRDLFTMGEKTSYDPGTILVILEAISSDAEIFPCGVGQILWQTEDEVDV